MHREQNVHDTYRLPKSAMLVGCKGATASAESAEARLGHGGEEQHAVAGGVQLDEEAVENLHLAALPHQQRWVKVRVARVAQHRMVAHLREVRWQMLMSLYDLYTTDIRVVSEFIDRSIVVLPF